MDIFRLLPLTITATALWALRSVSRSRERGLSDATARQRVYLIAGIGVAGFVASILIVLYVDKQAGRKTMTQGELVRLALSAAVRVSPVLLEMWRRRGQQEKE